MTTDSKFKRIASPYIVPGTTAGDGLRLVFDIEADALLDNATKLHCVVIADLDGDQIDEYGPDQIPAALEHLARADYLTGHNVSGYDLPLLLKLFNWTPKTGCTVVDTMVASRLILPHLPRVDDQTAGRGGAKLGALRGRHKLEAWGVRLGLPKAGADITDFEKWTPGLQERCVSDVALNRVLWRFLQPDGYSQQALVLEHRAAAVCGKITDTGVLFATTAANQLGGRWEKRCVELAAALCAQFPELDGKVTRQRLVALLLKRGWVPEELTETGKPSLKNDAMENLAAAYPEFAGAAEYFALGWLLGNMLRGERAWARCVKADGRIHAGLLHIGAPHSRASCLTPNLHGIPNPKKGAKFGVECRTLFHAPDGWVMVASDMANFQDRAFAHYLAEFDGGAYLKRYLSGEDMHWSTAGTLGLVGADVVRDKENAAHTALREGSKRFRYAFLFGAGAARLGHIILDTVRAVHNSDPELIQRFFGTSAPDKVAIKRVGARALEQFMASTPGLSRLRQSLAKQVDTPGWIAGLDGRRVPLLAQHTALNFLLVAAEAVVCKHWLSEVDNAIGKFGSDANIALWIHDEIVVCCKPEIAGEIGETMVRLARETGERFNLKVPLEAGFNIGNSWADKNNAAPRATALTAVDHEHDVAGQNSSINSVKAPVKEFPMNTEDDPIGDLPWVEPKTVALAPGAGDDSPRDEISKFRQRLLAAGFAPIPIFGKRPPMVGWQKQTATSVEDTERWCRQYPAAKNTGILTAHTPALDIDILGAAAADAVETLARERFGPRGQIIVRYGRQPKRCIPFRCDTPFAKIDAKLVPAGGGDTEKIEFLADRQQFVVAGIHPDTKQPYHWVGGDIGDVCRADLPTITESEARSLVADAVALLIGKHGYTVKQAKPKDEQAGTTAWAEFFADPTDHDLMVGFVMSLVRSGMTAGAITNMLRAIVGAAPGDAERKQRRLDEIPGIVSSAGAKCAAQSSGALISARASTFEMTAFDWLWEGRFAFGKLSLIVGLPDEGKGQFLSYLSAQLTTAGAWPCNEGQAPLGNVLMFTDEDDPHDTVRPRLEAAGADCDRVELVRMVHDNDKDRIFNLMTDLGLLRQKIIEIGDVKLVIIDPISAYLGVGKVDSFRTTDVRAVLAPLVNLAVEMHVAVVAVMHFNKKLDITNALVRISDSLAFGAVARGVYAIIDDNDNDRKLVVRAKNNIAANTNKTLAFRFVTREVGTDKKTGKAIWAPHIVFDPEYVDISAGEAMQAASENKSPGARDKAKTLLLGILAEGAEVSSDDIADYAKAHNLSMKTIKRAGDDLGVDIVKDRSTPKGKWFWKLPPKGENNE
jgi:DNA polymerase I